MEAHCSRSYRERYEFKIRYELELALEGREGGILVFPCNRMSRMMTILSTINVSVFIA